MTIQQIVEQWLREHGYDGLYSPDGGCACRIDDLFPCQEFSSDCTAGHVKKGCSDECGMGCEWHVVAGLKAGIADCEARRHILKQKRKPERRVMEKRNK